MEAFTSGLFTSDVVEQLKALQDLPLIMKIIMDCIIKRAMKTLKVLVSSDEISLLL